MKHRSKEKVKDREQSGVNVSGAQTKEGNGMENRMKGPGSGQKRRRNAGKGAMGAAGEVVCEETGKLDEKGLKRRKREEVADGLDSGGALGRSQDARSQDKGGRRAKAKQPKRQKQDRAGTSGEEPGASGAVSPNRQSGTKVRVESGETKPAEQTGTAEGKAKRKRKKKKKEKLKEGSDGGGENSKGGAVEGRNSKPKGEKGPDLERRPAGGAARAAVTAGGDKASPKAAPRQSSLLDKVGPCFDHFEPFLSRGGGPTAVWFSAFLHCLHRSPSPRMPITSNCFFKIQVRGNVC